MPTRTGTKPTSYTYTGAAILAYLFNDDEISGGVIDDITGNGDDATLQGTAATEATDSDHGKCLRGNSSGASLDPRAAFDSLTDYSVVLSLYVEDNINTSGGTETPFRLHDTGGADDSCGTSWLTSENTNTRLEDDSNNVTATITDAILNNAGEWVTFAFTFDSSTGDLYHYVIVDGESTQVGSSTGSSVGGSASTNNELLIASTWHGLLEHVQVFDTALTQTEVEDLHVDPYGDFSAGDDLVTDDFNSATSFESVSLVQQNTIGASGMGCISGFDSVLLQVAAELSVPDVTASSVFDRASLAQKSNLSVSDIFSPSVFESVILSQSNVLVVSDIHSLVGLESSDLTQKHTLPISSIDILQSLEGPVLTQKNVLSAQGVGLSSEFDSISLQTGIAINAADILAATTWEDVSLVQANILTSQGFIAGVGFDSPGLASHAVLSANNISIEAAFEGADLSADLLLQIQDMLSSTEIDGLHLDQANILVVPDVNIATSFDGVGLSSGIYYASRICIIQGYDRLMKVGSFDRIMKVDV